MLLLEKNQQLNLSPAQSQELLEEEEEGVGEGEGPERNSSADLIDDIMFMNEDIDIHDAHVSRLKQHLQSLANILQTARIEDLKERDEYLVAAKLAMELASEIGRLHTQISELLKLVDSINQLQRSRHPSTTNSLHHMLQLPILVYIN